MIIMEFPAFDSELLLYINGFNNVFLDGVMLKFSSTWTWSLMLLAVIFVVLRDRPLKEALCIFLGIGMCILSSVSLIGMPYTCITARSLFI